MQFSVIFKNLLTEKGLTQQFIAQQLKTTQQTISRWSKGQNEPDLSTLIKLAGIFEVSVGYLVGAEDDFGNVTVTSPATEELTYLEKRLLQAFSKLDASEKDKIIYDAEYFASKHDAKGVNLKKPLIG